MIALSRLKNAAHINFHESIYSSLSRQKDLNPAVSKLLANYRKSIDKETEASQRVLRSDIVAELRVANSRRDEAFRHLRLMVKFMKYRVDDATMEAYEDLSKACKTTFSSQIVRLDRAAKLDRMYYFAEVLHKYASFFKDFSDFNASLQELEEANRACEHLSALRTQEKSEIEVGAMQAARAQADRLYRLVLKTMECDQELKEELDEPAVASDQTTMAEIKKHEAETRRYMRVSKTWREKRKEKEADDASEVEANVGVSDSIVDRVVPLVEGEVQNPEINAEFKGERDSNPENNGALVVKIDSVDEKVVPSGEILEEKRTSE